MVEGDSPQHRQLDSTSMTNAPERRANHTAVWTGTQMIVWGGERRPSALVQWRTIQPRHGQLDSDPAHGAPTARYIHTAVWSGSEMIVWVDRSYSPCCDIAALNSGGDTSKYR